MHPNAADNQKVVARVLVSFAGTLQFELPKTATPDLGKPIYITVEYNPAADNNKALQISVFMSVGDYKTRYHIQDATLDIAYSSLEDIGKGVIHYLNTSDSFHERLAEMIVCHEYLFEDEEEQEDDCDDCECNCDCNDCSCCENCNNCEPDCECSGDEGEEEGSGVGIEKVYDTDNFTTIFFGYLYNGVPFEVAVDFCYEKDYQQIFFKAWLCSGNGMERQKIGEGDIDCETDDPEAHAAAVKAFMQSETMLNNLQQYLNETVFEDDCSCDCCGEDDAEVPYSCDDGPGNCAECEDRTECACPFKKDAE